MDGANFRKNFSEIFLMKADFESGLKWEVGSRIVSEFLVYEVG
jgi:hypothetical protein